MAHTVLVLTVLCLQIFVTFQSLVREPSPALDQRTRTFTKRQVRSASVKPARYSRDVSNHRDVPLCITSVTVTSEEYAKLQSNTHYFAFTTDDGTSITLAWIGDGTGIILALTMYSIPFSIWNFGSSSRLYRSEDYGKTFIEISSTIRNSFIRKDLGIMAGPGNSKRVILAADISEGTEKGGKIYTSVDAAEDFTAIDLPFHLGMKIIFHPTNENYLLTKSIDSSLWVSQDFGMNWKRIHESVYTVSWGPGNVIFFATHPNGTVDINGRGELHLKRTEDFGKTFHIVLYNVYNFGHSEHFLFASVVTDRGHPRKVFVSTDEGDTWGEAQLPPVTHDQFYSVLASDEEMIFMHVDEPGDNGFGTMYTSGDTGVLYSKSLENHWFDDKRGVSDFTNITSLRGVYITNILTKDGSIQSVITYDAGGKWSSLNPPSGSSCNTDECNLHIYGEYSMLQFPNVPMPPLTDVNAVGIIIAHGYVGNAIANVNPDVYVSDDGGYTWIKSLEGPHHYAILDSGGLIVAVEASSDKTVHTLKFSTDEGQCWTVYPFANTSFMFSGLASEPGTKSMNVSIWGYTVAEDSSTTWVTYTVDFKELLTKECDDSDYVTWLAHSTNTERDTDGCILGYKENFQRLKKSSVCINGRDYVIDKVGQACKCTKSDYLCDFGYYRQENSTDCVREPDLKADDIEFCLQGNEETLKTDGYRKIPGDKCEEGFVPSRKEYFKALCKSTASDKSYDSATTAMIIICTLLMTVIMILGFVMILRKYICGNRTFVYRYSALQQNADDRCITDGLDNVSAEPRGPYHDDSDEDLIE
ncbi:sortilin-like [Protopterus annectens]|uniref:sortilin-like n=1 Tax=Protopterus annectens TaxID=7888 RepID=UPI001CFA8542|nr:sortilin-like [Protopterus annectens]